MLSLILLTLFVSTLAMASPLSLLHNTTTLQASYSVASHAIRGLSSAVGDGDGYKTVTTIYPSHAIRGVSSALGIGDGYETVTTIFASPITPSIWQASQEEWSTDISALMHSIKANPTPESAALHAVRGVSSVAHYSGSWTTWFAQSSGFKTTTKVVPTLVTPSGSQNPQASSSWSPYSWPSGHGIGTSSGFLVTTKTVSTATKTIHKPGSMTSSAINTPSSGSETAHTTQSVATMPGVRATSDTTSTTTQLPSVQDPYTWPTTTAGPQLPSVEIPYTWSTTTRIFWTTLPSVQIPNPFFTNSGVVLSTLVNPSHTAVAPTTTGCDLEVCPPGSFDCHCRESARAEQTSTPILTSSATSSTWLPSCSDVVCPIGSVECCISD